MKPQPPIPSLESIGAHAQASAQAMTSNLTESMKSLAGMSLPGTELAKLQADYLSQASQLWNNAVAPLTGQP